MRDFEEMIEEQYDELLSDFFDQNSRMPTKAESDGLWERAVESVTARLEAHADYMLDCEKDVGDV